jgi:hypothetical protein
MVDVVSDRSELSRREFLVALFAVATVGCGSRGPTPEQVAAQAARYDEALRCTDVGALWPGERKTREDNHYVDRSTEPLRYCFNCTNFVPPAQDRSCASCRTVKGPIHPLGWCQSWTAKRS